MILLASPQTVWVPDERANVNGAAGSMSDRLAGADRARDGASTRYLEISKILNLKDVDKFLPSQCGFVKAPRLFSHFFPPVRLFSAGRWSSRISFEVNSEMVRAARSEEPLMVFRVKWLELQLRALLEK